MALDRWMRTDQLPWIPYPPPVSEAPGQSRICTNLIGPATDLQKSIVGPENDSSEPTTLVQATNSLHSRLTV